MSLQRLIVSSEQLVSDQIGLTPEQQHYLYRVLRLSVGQQFVALDGQGRQWLAELTPNRARAAIVNVRTAEVVSERPSIVLAIAISKGSGFDDLVRQATELGVTTLQPLMTERTLHRPNSKKLDRWQRIAAEATEQSERLLLPIIRDPLPWDEFVAQANSGLRFLAVARQSAPHLLSLLQQQGRFPADTITIATGPEGGWSPTEIAVAMDRGFYPVSLGTTILRAVTAPLAALAIAMAVLDSNNQGETSE